MSKKDKVSVDDIIGLVDCEPTNSVEEVRKLRGRTNERFKLVDDYLIEYDGDYFDLHKPSDIRSLVTVIKYVTYENEQLKKEKEFWKSDACSLSSLNSILSNELSIAQEQGYEPSKPYKEYIASIKTEYDKFWENKIKTHNNRLNGVRE